MEYSESFYSRGTWARVLTYTVGVVAVVAGRERAGKYSGVSTVEVLTIRGSEGKGTPKVHTRQLPKQGDVRPRQPDNQTSGRGASGRYRYREQMVDPRHTGRPCLPMMPPRLTRVIPNAA